MKLFIPACGDRVTLSKPWTFNLFLEYRNMKFAKFLKVADDETDTGYGQNLKRHEVTLPKGTVLECDRVYIRAFNKSRVQEGDDYDSITWKVVVNGKPVQAQRFWAKLADCNDIEFTQKEDDLYRNRVKLVKKIMER